MISENLLNSAKLISLSKSFQRNSPEIWEILLYGSAVKGKSAPRDVDIVIILKNKTALNHKLELSQRFRSILHDNWNVEFEVRAIDIVDLQDLGFLARTGIIAEGHSLIHKKPLCERFGFQNYFLFIYELKGLSPSRKKMFYYALKGRRGASGILQRVKGTQISDGAIKVPRNSFFEIKEFFEKYNLKYHVLKALFY